MNLFEQFMGKKLTIQIPLWVILAGPLVFYLGWEGYWYTRVGLGFIKWHTHIMLYGYGWLAGAWLIYSRHHFSEKRKNIMLAFTSTMLVLALAEISFVITGSAKVYMEQNTNSYRSPYIPQDSSWYHTYHPHVPHHITKPEYNYWMPTNSLGFADREWTTKKAPNQIRITAMGDSFTEGDGAPYDSSYVNLLGKKFQTAGYQVYMMNAGICASDPFNNYVLLRDKLLPYKTDYILQVISYNDMAFDILLRGGMERFKKDGSQQFAKAPFWEPLFAISYISRFFFYQAGYNELLLPNELTPEIQNTANKKMADLLQNYAILCHAQNIKLILFLRPDRDEIIEHQYRYDFSPVLSALKQDTNVQVVDLMKPYIQYIVRHNASPADYFWKHDGHHNSAGYEMMAQTIFESLKLQEPQAGGSVGL
ncbi:MAG: GDSL-type esterase/lipase family protein [Chitinophagales bacterium]